MLVIIEIFVNNLLYHPWRYIILDIFLYIKEYIWYNNSYFLKYIDVVNVIIWNPFIHLRAHKNMQSLQEIHLSIPRHKHIQLISTIPHPHCSLKTSLHPFASASLGELGLEIWQREMIRPLQKRLVGVLLMGIQQDRTATATDAPTSTIRGVIHSFVDVNMYKKKSTLQVGTRLYV